MISGRIADAREIFLGVGAQLCFPSTRPRTCVESNMEVMTRLSDEDCDLSAHMDRSRVGDPGVSQITMQPDCDRLLGVVDEQGRSHRIR